jgi:hypothetical protein
VGFCLLSRGIFRYTKCLEGVLQISLQAIQDFDGYQVLKEVHLCAFTKKEVETLVDVSDSIFGARHHFLNDKSSH